jgi:hypothetical protein
MMDWAAIEAAALRAEAAFEAMGHTWIGRYENADHQACLSRDAAGNVCLSISGTRFGQSIGDLLDDAYILPTDLGGGASVTSGAYGGMDELWAWAKSLVPTGTVWHVCGHSLGGQRSLLTGLFVPIAQIGSIAAFEAPKTGNAALWARLAPSLANATLVCDGEDLWFGWPIVSEWSHPPLPHIHLLPTGFEIVEPGNWPPAINPGDHAVELDVSRISAIAAH